MYDAIILAGGKKNKDFGDKSTSSYEAMIDIDGQPMVTFVAKALSASLRIQRILVVGPEQELRKCHFPPNAVILSSGETLIDTIRIGINALGHSRNVLVVTADIPMLTPEAINDFIDNCEQHDADFYYPIVNKETNEKHYPGNKRTYVKVKEGTFTGGNIFMVNPLTVPNALRVADPIIENRKNPLKLCAILGWSFVFKFLLGTLTLVELEQSVSDLLDLRGKVILSQYPELGIDVDKISDLHFVRTNFSFKG